jgi:hypothetical protein
MFEEFSSTHILHDQAEPVLCSEGVLQPHQERMPAVEIPLVHLHVASLNFTSPLNISSQKNIGRLISGTVVAMF